MILFKVGFDVKILSSKEDLQGRYIIAKLEIQGEVFVIVNIYAPNKITEKDLFFQNISSEFEKYDITLSDKLILGGDWNSILDINLDKKGGNKNIINTKPKKLSELTTLYELKDIWRILNPAIERYTFRQKNPLVQTRLDYFLISNNMQDLIVKTDIIHSIRSDHSAISMHIKHIQEEARGSGHWKFNSSLITDVAYTGQLGTKN